MSLSEIKNKTVVVIFSKDRALQLDAAIRSLYLNCLDKELLDIKVIYKASDYRYQEQYNLLIKTYNAIEFKFENYFKTDVLSCLDGYQYVSFMVDDNLFVNSFSINEVQECLEENPDCLGFSLRLGLNTHYCYMLDREQKIPEFTKVKGNISKFNWSTAEYDFNYPLELTSSVYKIKDIYEFILSFQFNNPNQFEAYISSVKDQSSQKMLLCYNTSLVFCVPINLVQNQYNNRHSSNFHYSVEDLAKLFSNNMRINVEKYKGFISNSSQQEIELFFIKTTNQNNDDKIELIYSPLISIIIPCYNHAKFLPEAIDSVINQTYKNIEIIIVNDGSTDNSSEVALELVNKYNSNNIKVINKINTGLADARNTGIKEAKGEWILPLDSDDMFEKSYLKRAVTLMNKDNKLNFISTNLISFGTRIFDWILPEYNQSFLTEHNSFIYASLYKKELWEKSGGYNPVIPWGAEDWEFWIRLSKLGLNYKKVKDSLFIYRTHEESMVTIMTDKFTEVVAFIKTLHPDIYDKKILNDSYELIAKMDYKTFTLLEKKASLFPEYSIIYFWFGLYYEEKNNLEEALYNYHKSTENIENFNWQPYFKLASLCKKLNMLEESKKYFLEYKKRAKLVNSLL